MVHAKNYEIVSTFVKVTQKKNCDFVFFRTRCTIQNNQQYTKYYIVYKHSSDGC